MTVKMDPKSLVVGAAAAVLVLMSMAVARKDQNSARDADKTESLKERLTAAELFQKLTMPQPGRFQAESTEVYTIILDTATGQAWRYHLSMGKETELCPAKLEPAGD